MNGLLKSDVLFFMGILILAVAATAAASPPVIINEIHYHPDTRMQGEEFVEIYNASNQIIDLFGWRFSNGIKYKFPPGVVIQPGEFLVIARDPLALKTATGFDNAFGPYSGKLDNAGERLTLLDNSGTVVDELIYCDEGEWRKEADGSGASLERISPFLPGKYGASWRASAKTCGTPGAQNSAYEENPAPIIIKTRHDPPVPKPGEFVTITCCIIDNSGAVKSATLEHRKDGDASYEQTPMYDDGKHGDGMAGDNMYGAGVRGLGDGERLEFRIKAVDEAGGETVAPPDSPIKTFLCPFSHHVPPEDLPTYRIVTTAANRKELETRDLYSDEILDATFIGSDEKIHYNVGLRYRGGNSRKWPKKSYRVNFHKDNPLDEKGATKLTLMAVFPANQFLSYDLFRRAGVPAPETRLVRVHLNETNLEVYNQLEVVDEDFVSRAFFNEDSGNLYRGMKQGELNYLGEDPKPYREKYIKRTNADIDEWGDLIRLTDILTNAPDDQYAEKVAAHIDVDNWLRFFATHTVLNNWEGGIYNWSGDDYYLYFRPSDGRAVIVPWDLDTAIMGSQFAVWIATVPASRRFLHHPAFTLPFLKTLRHIIDHEFSRESMFQKIDSLPKSAASDDYKMKLKKMVEERHCVIHDEIHSALTLDAIDQYGLCQAFPRKTEWRYLRGTGEPTVGALIWTHPDFDDSTWGKGPAIFGYGDADDTTDFPEMRNTFLSVYIRKEFYILNPEDFKNDRAVLKVNYNDGYIAFLNGTEIARSNMGEPGSFVPYNVSATDIHGAGLYETRELRSIAPLLKRGRNVLAIQAHNADIADWTFSIDAYLFLAEEEKQQGREWTVPDQEKIFNLQGRANQWKTQRVEVNGQSVPYSFITGTWNYQSQIKSGTNTITVRSFDDKGSEIEKLDQTFHLIMPITDETQKFPLPDFNARKEGVLEADETWTVEGGPYYVPQDLRIPRDRVLTIQSGTVVLLGKGASITVSGGLSALGTESAPVRFMDWKDAPWGSITLTNANRPVRFSHCRFQRSSMDTVAILMKSSSALIDHSVFQYCSRCVEIDSDSFCEFKDNFIIDSLCNSQCVHAYEGGTLQVESCAFYDCLDAVEFTGESKKQSFVRNSYFIGGPDDGIDSNGCSVLIEGNYIAGITDKGISLGLPCKPVIRNNLVYHCGIGIAVKQGCEAWMDHNTLVQNKTGIMAEASSDTPALGGGKGTLHSSIIWNNKKSLNLKDASTLSISYSNVQSEQAISGNGNINRDPGFINSSISDFRLKADSPCIKSGKDGTDMGAFSFSRDAPEIPKAPLSPQPSGIVRNPVKK
ncbi:CotH kinase family protein [Candidatus Sumerlaeota bacterium]|nr:CotH kinase family protein [Candidatus Sumerlaeota bacterium]